MHRHDGRTIDVLATQFRPFDRSEAGSGYRPRHRSSPSPLRRLPEGQAARRLARRAHGELPVAINDHLHWGILLLVLPVWGSGMLSVDGWLTRDPSRV